ncbi:MAG: transketolase [Candidatus Muproteobacteria bacterium RIFCSPHIGHO2_12_FULL_60_33]|uniref:Transketolase n=1 Tax=Candidatus Muproteobacteria bacterium RIFCSPLOWO2_01_FULL_60_18 TaxID=1817768 RepID=A0A1F6U3W1_9PROT|nr:MAG: transketolase [Candidatus Muproteobacteria bacterium RIFCSPLOWO2_01_FULL_60_18]OGI53253.1 MAG: transketolase [Candidatus Muproteobacteria bacterium RIFCSPHIGHO2_01_60_12]OGI54261.1 MAG: transketolase [Candidatus Muproteobacteria bacterium RIFCSPHIGHO2_02_FULL_60_13]OGI55554.1 MAG: transketolase [Candidatus Muproteobacteria bacterium RIFCSPHIGHO2_12_FULL_60_33]OGI59283.1 MAG: transketolase [Candidatus Muproteobacteria bacterium RIFCSPHIGHO2_01_FULL_61_200]
MTVKSHAPKAGEGKTLTHRRELANAIRALSMDAVQKANSGHPGAPMGMADIAEVLWNDFLRHNPANPKWVDRDRFVLSNGHGSMLLYSLLHLTGYDLPMEEIKNFRQLHSKTPGHPEYGYAPGVETTTGPLGQGIANAVGMAIAEKVLAGQFNRDGHHIVDHYTYVFLGDGCLMEGISHEACSLAGTLGLGKLIAFYDDNNISIDGHVDGWFTDNTPKRFEAYGWHVVPNVDGHDPEAVRKAIMEARAVNDKPSMICCKTVIGYGAPNLCGSHDCHGAALGEAEVAATRENLGWKHEPFVIPQEIYAGWDAKGKGATAEKHWNDKFAAYKKAYPELAAEFERRMKGELPKDWNTKAEDFIKSVDAKAETIASRKASQNTLNGFGPLLPEFLGGSADLAGSNLTIWKGSKGLSNTVSDGNYIYYGVREFGMSAIMNGIVLHGGFIPYGATFLMFSEYARNALRMAALMKIPTLFVYTHDSIGLGEDGPTHQAVEQTATLRLIPNMSVWRPCDAVESAAAWKLAVERKQGPSCLIFSRQNLPHQKRDAQQLAAISRGGYVLSEAEGGKPQAVIIATGSEVGIAMEAQKLLTAKGKNVRVVSMPSTDTFDAQDAAWRDSVLPKGVRRVAVEAGVTDGWYKYVGLDGKVVGLNRFGESAPAGALFKHFGFTGENVAKTVEEIL